MIKLLGFLFMLIDHIGLIFFPDCTFLRVLGRLALPLFAYGIALGFFRTTNINKYVLRLFLLAIISQVPYTFVFNSGYFNVLFTLVIGLLSLILIDSNLNVLLKIIGFIILVFICDVLYFEYGAYCILLILSFYTFKENPLGLILSHVFITALSIYIYNYPNYQFFAIFSIFIISLFNSVDLKINKIVSYGFYPIHLVLIFLAIYYN